MTLQFGVFITPALQTRRVRLAGNVLNLPLRPPTALRASTC